MKSLKVYKVYREVRKIREDYYEAVYTEYTQADGQVRITGYGTEDFSKERLKSATKVFDVYKYNGKVNKAGGRMTDCVGSIRTSKNACKIQVARMLLGDDVVRVG